MKISEIFPSRWFKAVDLGPDGQTVTIKKVTMKEVGEERESKPVMTFDEIDKELVLNVTNANTIADVTGEDDSDNWPGQVIKLVRVKVQYGAKRVDAVRIEAPDGVAEQPDAETNVKGEIPY